MRDARLKLVALLLALVAVSLTRLHLLFAIYAVVLLAIALIARLSLAKLLRKACAFVAFFAALALALFLSNQTARAVDFLEKSTLCAFAVLLFISTTEVNDVSRALAWFRAPVPLLLVIQFLYRYLFVISDQARRMRQAAASRGGFRFSSAAGALAVLFLRSWQRADGIHAAMLARGFNGKMPR